MNGMKFARGSRNMLKFNIILSVIFMVISLWGFMAVVFLSNMEPLAGSVKNIKIKVLIASITLFILSLGIILFEYFRFLRVSAQKGNIKALNVTLKASGIFIVCFALAWILFIIFIYILQDKLLFSPGSIKPGRLNEIRTQRDIEEISIKMSDNTVLHGWLVKQGSKNNKGEYPLVIVFSGQGGEASGHIKHARKIHACHVALINYRGYGLSQGIPSETAFYSDAIEIFDYFSKRPDIAEDKIFALGGSLGTGVAVHLAAHRPLAGVILFSPYDKLAGGVIQDIIPFIPTSIIFKNSFNALKDAPFVKAPILFLIAENDRVIRPKRSEKLKEVWGEKCVKIIIKGADHYSIYDRIKSWEHVNNFLSDIIGRE